MTIIAERNLVFLICEIVKNEKDFPDYLNQYICDEESVLVYALTGVNEEEQLPEEYTGLTYFKF